MIRLFFLTIALLFTLPTFAQTEPPANAEAVANFKKFYNAGQPDSLFKRFSTEMKTALPIDQFKATTLQLKSQLGNLQKAEFIKTEGPLSIYKAAFDKGTFLLNVALNDQKQYTGLLLKPYEAIAPAVAAQSSALDASLAETPYNLKTLAGNISGSLVMPKNATGKIPVVLIIAGSGPTDRDGNSPKLGLAANDYLLLANELGKNGIASVRYDKRLIGKSTSTTKESELKFDDMIEDALGLINQLNDDQHYSKIIVAGHSEGSLVGMLASQDAPVNGFISLAGAGEQADKILTEQMKSQPKFIADGFKAVLDSLRKGKLTPNVDPGLYAVARPSIQNYLMTWCRFDPAREIKKLKIPVLIVQGTTDLQVTVANAEKLKKAKSDAQLLIIPNMNHVLKDAPADPAQNKATYTNPNLPLKPELVKAVVDFVGKVK
ncbi:hypothetical protein GCM10023149_31700 [Mucilaginibacter gynuensis]|uniref:Serine aminopeptidase S33 domain-containing protein n=1 Tax=Mucilaginibacter gynuensis TaxID=1302236 RepID=A0ABP8GQ30_9SPHI